MIEWWCRLQLFWTHIALAALWQRSWEEENALREWEGYPPITKPAFELSMTMERMEG